MSLRPRYLWVDDKDKPHGFPASRFFRVFGAEESVPEFSGQQIRFVEALVETENRKPVSISRLTYPLITFDESGFIDKVSKEQEVRGVLGLMTSTFLESPREENLLRSGGRFEKKQFESRFRWEPNRELERLIVRVILQS